MQQTKQVIEETKKWINKVVIGNNFCPFASKAMMYGKVHYQVEYSSVTTVCTNALHNELMRLDEDESIETSFLIFPNTFKIFDDYLDLVNEAEYFLQSKGYEGIYQIASFHPLYLFAGSTNDDAANYTNRSIYPMLHLLRESSIDKALLNYKNPEEIPSNNLKFAKEKGLLYFQMLKDSCRME
ncbi:MAG: DUF1415 domain-containing protein [Ferruginibacter sp.]|nr:DUF1415 domain-containing protein [Ferruginibacter sp.]